MIRNLLFLLFSLYIFSSCQENHDKNSNIIKGDRLYDEGFNLLEKNDIKAYLKFQEAISYYNKENDFSNISKSLILQANAQQNKGDFLGAESTLVEALKLMKDDDESLYSLYDTMANLKLDQHQYSQALEWYNKALSSKIESEKDRLSILCNKSVAEYKLKRYKSALEILKNIDLSKISSLNLINRIKDNIEYIEWLDNNNTNAQTNIEKILKLKLENDDLWGANSSYAHLADITKKSNPEKSLYYAKKMLETAHINKSPEDKLEALEKIIYVDKPINLNRHFKIYKKLSDSIQSSRNDYTSKFAFIKYENTKVKAEKVEKENQLLWLSLVLALFVAIFILVVILYKKRQKRLQQEKELEVKNTQLKMSKKVHDVVANGIYQVMAKIENQEDFDRNKALDELEFVYEKSRDLSYEKAGEEKEFSQEISELIAGFNNTTVKTFTAGNDPSVWEKVSPAVKEEVYQMVRELMVNMKKHSQASHVAVKFENTGETVEIQYKDNGVGISGDLIYKNGLRNTASRIEAIGGTITFDTKIEKGLKVNLSFPSS
ncbi:tetratricopeptide repeat-containing sensor histidine kinase [uncultured Chryseobacterium sp.]|uniref:tetratricopeptide repeat-containing sensor histidine kinase n=1 Tax=uncultured Chryseobacterium sp. TaxID=259322 RepID=UPI0025DEA6A3|nr:tetratricopeptide repeat-containing sensor histidine kinase [uncultured Chryseobacterium sp.]